MILLFIIGNAFKLEQGRKKSSRTDDNYNSGHIKQCQERRNDCGDVQGRDQLYNIAGTISRRHRFRIVEHKTGED